MSQIHGKQIINSSIVQAKLNLVDPVANQDAVTLSYFNNNISAALVGLSWKQPAKVATTGNITLSGIQTIDGVAVIVGDRVLVKNQTIAANNGLYTVAAGTWSRTTDADANTEVIANLAVFISEGAVNADTAWTLQTNNPIVLGTTPLSFVQFNGTGNITASGVLTKTGNDITLGIGQGLENDGSNNLRVKTKDSTINRDASGISSVTRTDQQNLTASTTTADGQIATNVTLAKTPIGVIMVDVNGVHASIGNGVKTSECYFSSDGGTTARNLSSIVAGDSLYWNGSVAQYQLASTDVINFKYNSYL